MILHSRLFSLCLPFKEAKRENETNRAVDVSMLPGRRNTIRKNSRPWTSSTSPRGSQSLTPGMKRNNRSSREVLEASAIQSPCEIHARLSYRAPLWGFQECERVREKERKREKKRESKTERERKRYWFGEHLLHPTLCIKAFVLLLIRCPHGTVLLDMVGMDHMAVGTDVDVAAGVESRKYAPMSSGSARSAALETGGVVQIADTLRVSEATKRISRSRQLKKNCCLGEDAGWYGRRRAYLGWQESSGEGTREIPKKKLNGPKKTAKHIEAKQNWINRESKRLKAETARLAELQESLRVRKETLKVAFEKIKILREDLLREGETMDKNKSHFLSPEDTEEIRRLEQQELAFWRGSASKRLAGWTRDGSSGGNRCLDDGGPETQQRSRSKEEKTADAMDGLDGSLSSCGCKHGYCKQYRV